MHDITGRYHVVFVGKNRGL